jgi:hypothetical protein
VAVSPDGRTAWVAIGSLSSVTPIDTQTNTAGTPIAVSSPPLDVLVSPDGTTVYSADHNSKLGHPDRYRDEDRRPADHDRRGAPAPRHHAGRRRRAPSRTGFRANWKQRRAIELRAMAVATERYVRLGAKKVKDTSASNPFDLQVELAERTLSVEVKETVGHGDEILLTRGEVEHHRKAPPDNALVVVSRIRLEAPSDAPTAHGGVINVIEPWALRENGLTPLSYRYAIPPAGGQRDE